MATMPKPHERRECIHIPKPRLRHRHTSKICFKEAVKRALDLLGLLSLGDYHYEI
jgi:hypothetical protein